MQEDLDFISGKFFDFDVPKQQRFLLKYLKTDLQIAFLRYYLVFGQWKNFVDHTGNHCTKVLLAKLEKRYKALTEAHAKALDDFTEEGLELLGLIEEGKYRY
jgi:hypothetical protein